MGTYCYRIHTKAIELADGTKVHRASYAYKPWGDHRQTERAHKRYVGPSERAWGRKPPEDLRNVLVVEGPVKAGSAVIQLDYCPGYYYDDGPHYVGLLVERNGKLMLARYALMDKLVARRTAFKDMNDLLGAGGSYRPSCDVSDPEMQVIADYYDELQERRGSDKRAYRYGEPFEMMLEGHLTMKLSGLL